ncbi:MAG: radical SAM protein [Pirellulales bacterium]
MKGDLEDHVRERFFKEHPRSFRENRYVYPVLSRRAGGLSIGVNVSPGQICSFDCVYCQVNRSQQATQTPVEVEPLAAELDEMLGLVTSGEIYRSLLFRHVPEPQQRLNDIAFSGDGEPTACPNFDEVVAACANVKRRHHLDAVKIVLITNASLLHRPTVRRALEMLDANQGEIWAKLDAGTEGYFKRVNRSPVPWRRILENITEAARVRPLVIQSLLMRINAEPPSAEEQAAYCQRLNEITGAGGRIKLVQIYTIARRPADPSITALENDEVDAWVKLVQERTGLATAGFYGT